MTEDQQQLELRKIEREKDVQKVLNILDGKRIGYAREVITEVDKYLTFEAHFTVNPKDPSP